MLRRFVYCVSAILICLNISCNFAVNNEVDEGVIEYNIIYPNIGENDILLEFLPNKMEFIFKNNSYRNNINAGMGLFQTSIINNKSENNIIQTVKLLNNKYASYLEPDDLLRNPNFQKLEIKLLDGKKMVAGYPCKIAQITVRGDSTWTYKAYYTDKIKIENPNRFTPFEKINGVLLDYQIVKYNTHMHFTASEVIAKKISVPFEEIEEGYEIVPSEKIGSEIKNIFAKLKQ